MSVGPLVAGAAGRPTLSFELFPPRSPAARDALHGTVERLAATGPDFFSVTHGAAGTTRTAGCELLAHLRRETRAAAVAHLTCVGSTRRGVVELAEEFFAAGVRDVLALRGDPPAGSADWRAPADAVRRACDLVELLRVADRRHRLRAGGRGGAAGGDGTPLTVAVAAFPSSRRAGDLQALRAKQDAGASFAITQVCYSAREYAAFTATARAAGITLPLLPGIIPTTDPARLLRLEQLTGVPVPRSLLALLESAAEHGDAARERAGTRYGRALARDLLHAGAPGLHLYTFNSAPAALDLLEGAHLGAGTPTVPSSAGRPQASAVPHHAALAAGGSR
ncbi:methylenetetrahydrofolate reductase [Kineococcus sp. SYSU DK005]|uniref:methylenetetrahydrofolate reductase n=1 Tax=Kineococcus sp. SYSU DK005 TaxID=3383126 RepID=UPI003D7C38B5